MAKELLFQITKDKLLGSIFNDNVIEFRNESDELRSISSKDLLELAAITSKEKGSHLAVVKYTSEYSDQVEKKDIKGRVTLFL